MPNYIKRPNYFTSQLLQEGDFQAEQSYHRDMRYLRNKSLHSWGIVDGLDVTRTGDRQISITSGMAIDKDGHELVFFESEDYTLTTTDPATPVHIILTFKDDIKLDEDRYTGGGVDDEYTRLTERPEIADVPNPPQDGSVLILAQLSLNNGTITTVDTSVRTLSSAEIADGAIATQHIQDAAITPEKLASPRQFITGDAKHGDLIPVPQGTQVNDWVIFISPKHLPNTTDFQLRNPPKFSINVFAEPSESGWKVNCFIQDENNPNRQTGQFPGTARYLLLKT